MLGVNDINQTFGTQEALKLSIFAVTTRVVDFLLGFLFDHFYLSVCMSVCLSVCLFIYLSISTSVYLLRLGRE